MYGHFYVLTPAHESKGPLLLRPPPFFFLLFSFSLLFATGRHRSIIPCRDRCLFKAVGVAVPLSPFSSHDQTVGSASLYLYTADVLYIYTRIVQELRESRGGRPGLSVLTSLLVSVDVKLY